MSLVNFLLAGGPFATAISTDQWGTGLTWLKTIANFLDSIIVPVTIIVAVAGAVWVIWLGVQLAKVEKASDAGEAKKRLINVVIAIVFVIVIIWLLTWFSANAGTIFKGNPIGEVVSS